MMRIIGCALVLTGAGLLVGGCSTTNAWPVARNQAVAWNVDGAIPPQLRVPQGHRLLGYVVGRGTGTYTLRADPTDPDGRIWVQTANEGGELFDEVGDAIGHHGDNTWSTNNGNQVTGQPVAAVRQNNGTQWALYRATSNQGKGALGDSQYVLQVQTTGGPPHPTDRDPIGMQVRAPYSASYYFYGRLVPATRIDRGGVGE